MEEQEIINLMKENPEAGIHEAISRYGGAVETICRNFLFDCQQMDIEEAVADSFVKLWKAKDRIKISEDKSLKSYIYEIARNTARDKRRSLRRETIFSIEEVELQLCAPLNIEEDYARHGVRLCFASELARKHRGAMLTHTNKLFFYFRFSSFIKNESRRTNSHENGSHDYR